MYNIDIYMNIYLDIDGVLIDTKEYKPMPYLQHIFSK